MLTKGNILVRLFKAKDAIPILIGKLRITAFETCEVVYENDDAFDLIGRSEIIEVDAPHFLHSFVMELLSHALGGYHNGALYI